MFSLTQAQRYGVAVIGVVIAAVLRMALDPLLGEELPLFIFAFPVIVAAWFGGLWPGLLATALSLALGDYLFIAPRGTLPHYNDLLTLNRLSFLLFFGLVMSILAERLRRSIKNEIDSMERSRLLIEGVEDYAILMLDSQGRVISWNSGAEERVRALSSGFQMLITRPIAPEEMIAVVASLVGRIHFDARV